MRKINADFSEDILSYRILKLKFDLEYCLNNVFFSDST